MDDITLLVNTRGRIDRQFTLMNLSPSILKHVIIVCFPGEKEGHLENWEGKVKAVIEHPKDKNHIGLIRQWCLEYFNTDYVIFMDDNLVFNIRVKKADKGNLRNNPLYEIKEDYFYSENVDRHQKNMLLDIIDKLYSDEYAMVGMSARFGNNRVEVDFVENCRFYGFLAVNNKLYKECNYRKFSDVSLKEDFYMMLHFLTNGYKIGCFYKWAIEKVQNANAPGGCSTYRTVEKSNQSAYDLQKHFPDFVRVREKSVKSWSGDFLGKEVALDVTVYWKKAYEFGLKQIK